METKASPARSGRLGALAVGALGVVYGDIGTSPLYAIRECFSGAHGVVPTRENVLGILSLVFWTLMVVVTLKYLLYVLRADNRGEGGILALMALVRSRVGGQARRLVLGLGLFGAALLYADGVLTPVVSVLGAVEGLTVAAPTLHSLVVPISALVLVALFQFQHRGTAGIGAIFGPVMLTWFAVLAVLGAGGIVRHPGVWVAVYPLYGYRFLLEHGAAGFLVLGAVFLVATGGEALYADLGHFGTRPIRVAWFAVAGVALVLNYFGQGALLLVEPGAAVNPFYRLAPGWALLPLLGLATMAAVIASQAIISGAFSLTRQAVQLGYLPRLEIIHTSSLAIGQIYIPAVNWILMVACLGLTAAFRSSSNIAGAYGVALTSTMLITTLLAHQVARKLWGWPWWTAAALTGLLLVPDLAFFASALVKVPAGGWFPLVVAAAVLAVMSTWNRGRALLGTALGERLLSFDTLLRDLERGAVPRTSGAAVFLTGDEDGTPLALLHNLKLNGVIHRQNVFLTVKIETVPHVPQAERLELRDLGSGFHRLIARFGFMEDADVPTVLAQAGDIGLVLDPARTTYVLSRNLVAPSPRSTLARWRRRLFIVMSRNAVPAEEFFGLPANRVVALGARVEV